jgi:ferrochelatase
MAGRADRGPVNARLPEHLQNHEICYQSRVGPLKWIGPSTEEAIERACQDDKHILLTPIAFVSEHIETLVELDEEYAELAEEHGAKRL